MCLQYEGDWSPAHAKLSSALTQLLQRMLRHLLQVAPNMPQLPRKIVREATLLENAVQQLSDPNWQAVSC
jgi:hypothetical protein